MRFCFFTQTLRGLCNIARKPEEIAIIKKNLEEITKKYRMSPRRLTSEEKEKVIREAKERERKFEADYATGKIKPQPLTREEKIQLNENLYKGLKEQEEDMKRGYRY